HRIDGEGAACRHQHDQRIDPFVVEGQFVLVPVNGAEIEAGNIVAALIDTDGRHTDDELRTWVGAVGEHLTPPMILTPAALRSDDTLGGRAAWLERPSTMFDLFVAADQRDGTSHARTYYHAALGLAHATAAIDLVPSASELDAIDDFRTMLLNSIGPTSGRPTSTNTATTISGGPGDSEDAHEIDAPPMRPTEEVLAELDALVGLETVKHEVRRLTSLLRVQRLRAERDLPTVEVGMHLVFTGNPGTGKTTVARLLSQIMHSLGVVSRGHLVETDRSGLVAGYVGQTATTTRAVLESALGGTLLIDEAYALARGGDNDFGLEAIDTIVKFMEDHRDDLSVIAAGYPNEMDELIKANPGLQSRFTRTIEFPDYSTDELIAIFELISGNKGYELAPDGRERLAEVIEAEPRGRGFGNGRFARNVFEASIGAHAMRLADVAEPTDEQLITLTAADIVR
ncbi:MAG: AAA family ATPase, partial [Actinomycetota bacterium]